MFVCVCEREREREREGEREKERERDRQTDRQTEMGRGAILSEKENGPY